MICPIQNHINYSQFIRIGSPINCAKFASIFRGSESDDSIYKTSKWFSKNLATNDGYITFAMADGKIVVEPSFFRNRYSTRSLIFRAARSKSVLCRFEKTTSINLDYDKSEQTIHNSIPRISTICSFSKFANIVAQLCKFRSGSHVRRS